MNVSDETFFDLILEAESEKIFELILSACSDQVWKDILVRLENADIKGQEIYFSGQKNCRAL